MAGLGLRRAPETREHGSHPEPGSTWRAGSGAHAISRRLPDSSRSAAGGDVRARACFLERRLRGGEACERDPERRARHVVEAELVAERDRARLAAVLAADTELELRLRAPPPLDGDPHQVADAVDVDHLERIALEHPVLEVARQELALSI